jgi:DNA-binding MarR family transcriptional regulator
MAYDLNWELRLGFLVHDVSRLRRSVVDRTLKPLGVTRSQWWVLAFLSRADGMSQVALAEELDLGKVALGGLIDRLEKTGFVSRRHDAEDRRVKRVFLTKKSHTLINEIRASVSVTERVILDDIEDADLKATVRALRKMKENLLKMLAEAGEEIDASDAA